MDWYEIDYIIAGIGEGGGGEGWIYMMHIFLRLVYNSLIRVVGGSD